MISKRIGAKHDNYGRLANYIAGAGVREKTLHMWMSGFINNLDYQDCIAEAQDTQACNVRTQKTKTYHLMISFRTADEAILTPELFEQIEKRFAQALGYEEHQRHCGVHKNTANLHMHIAYNMIHPEKLTRHEPFRDYWIRDKLCRQLEQEFGLTVDRGREKPAQNRISEKAATLEAKTGQESFASYAGRQKPHLLTSLGQARTWQDFQQSLSAYGLEIARHGNGFVIKNIYGKEAIKASAVDHSFSLHRLTERFGAFEPARKRTAQSEICCYRAEPLHRCPERGKLYSAYRKALETRISKLELVAQEEQEKLASIRWKWEAQRCEILHMNIAKKNRRNLAKLARAHEQEELAKARLEMQLRRDAIKSHIPFANWTAFLKIRAAQGNEVALAILRSKKELIEPEQSQQKDWSTHGAEQTGIKQIWAEHAGQNRSLQERRDIGFKTKRQLQAVLRMDQCLEEARAKGSLFGEAAVSIDGKGTVIFTLSTGDSIRDSGKEVSFSPSNLASAVARLYCLKKWGQRLEIDRQGIRYNPTREPGTITNFTH